MVNYRKSYHHRKLAFASGLIYRKLDVHAPLGCAMLGESAFVTRNINGRIVRSRKTTENAEIPSDKVIDETDLILQRVVLSELQSAE